ncbi:hypothetical protein D3C86_1981280 [compost metagenome]
MANCRACLVSRPEPLRVQIPDMVLDRQELETAFVRDDDPDGFTAIFDNLLAHANNAPSTPEGADISISAKDEFREFEDHIR